MSASFQMTLKLFSAVSVFCFSSILECATCLRQFAVASSISGQTWLCGNVKKTRLSSQNRIFALVISSRRHYTQDVNC